MFRPLLRVVLASVFALAIVLTYTRGIWIAATFAVLVLTLQSVTRTWIRLATAAAFIVLALLAVEPMVTSRLGLDPQTRQLRVSTWEEGLQLFAASPIYGTGWAVGSADLPEGLDRPYNLWINVAASTGVVGLIVLSVFLVRLLQSLIHSRDRTCRAILAYASGFLVLSFGEMTWYANGPHTIEFFVLAAVGSALAHSLRERSHYNRRLANASSAERRSVERLR
jgi:O-antigen ligase